MKALMLAAGMGKRLGKFTNNNTKCMVEIAGKKLIDRAIEAVKKAGIKEMIIVVGYCGENLIRYINENHSDGSVNFKFIDNKDYAISNNIYSFYMAREYLVEDDIILLESDLIYDTSIIKKLVEDPHSTIAAVAKYASWMDGTCVTLDENNDIVQFVDKVDMDFASGEQYYKTVNIYKLSKEFNKRIYIPFLEAYMKAYGLNSYYETVLKVISPLAESKIYGYDIGNMPWYEIDDAQDYDIASVMFSKGKDKYNLVMSKFGGYWRYERMIDFCYLVNPYFPPKRMFEKLQREFPVLLCDYPSGLSMQNMNAERVFGVDMDNILVGNGAAELINVLGQYLTGKVAVALPTFNEYVRCFRNAELVKIDNSAWDYAHNVCKLKEITANVDTLMIVNPDNPSGYLIDYDDLLSLIETAKGNNCRIVIDESFVDFAVKERRFTLLNNELLKKYDNLVVVKSISKSYGVPGLRLGVLSSSDGNLIKSLRSLMQVWNINSFAEYYLQIYNLYAKDYSSACDKIAAERTRMISELKKINGIKVYDSEANYIMVDLNGTSSYDFCVKMLDKYNILMKDLSTKNYFEGKNFIRIAVRDSHDNDLLIAAMVKEIK